MELPKFFNDKVVGNRKKILSELINSCDKCNHLGYIETGDDMFVDCDCVKKFYDIKRYVNIGLTDKDIYKVDDLRKTFPLGMCEKLEKLGNHVKDYFKHDFLFFIKSSWSYGTDIAAKYVFKKFSDSKYSCFCVSMKQLLDMFFDFEDEKYAKCLEFLKHIDVLLITGFGCEYNSKMKSDDTFVVSSMNGFLSERIDKTTILSSQFTKEILHKTYSKQFVSLIINNFLGFGVESLKRQETEYEIIKRKNLDIGFEELDIIKPQRKRL